MEREVREVLEAAFWVMFPKPETYVFDLEADARHYRFTRLLDAEAYTDAALMLVPEGMFYGLQTYIDSDGKGQAMALVSEDHIEEGDWWRCDCRAGHPALAIAQASLKTKEPSHD
jgi:hypothetical protein